jgi:hypothetical protein
VERIENLMESLEVQRQKLRNVGLLHRIRDLQRQWTAAGAACAVMAVTSGPDRMAIDWRASAMGD